MKLVQLLVGGIPKSQINEFGKTEQNIRDLCRDVCEYKKGYKPIINLVKYENGNLLLDFHNILTFYVGESHVFLLSLNRPSVCSPV
jgi:hypothetical protein